MHGRTHRTRRQEGPENSEVVKEPASPPGEQTALARFGSRGAEILFISYYKSNSAFYYLDIAAKFKWKSVCTSNIKSQLLLSVDLLRIVT